MRMSSVAFFMGPSNSALIHPLLHLSHTRPTVSSGLDVRQLFCFPSGNLLTNVPSLPSGRRSKIHWLQMCSWLSALLRQNIQSRPAPCAIPRPFILFMEISPPRPTSESTDWFCGDLLVTAAVLDAADLVGVVGLIDLPKKSEAMQHGYCKEMIDT